MKFWKLKINICDNMSLIEEYGERRFQKGFEKGVKIGKKRVILSLLESGMSVEEISRLEVFTSDEILEAEKWQVVPPFTQIKLQNI